MAVWTVEKMADQMAVLTDAWLAIQKAVVTAVVMAYQMADQMAASLVT